MEVVATRDIEPGEEILIDYGDKWEDAWNRHLLREPTGKLEVVTAAALNRRIAKLKIGDEEGNSQELYSDEDVTVVCIVGSERQESSIQDDKYDMLHYDWTYEEFMDADASNMFPCSILAQETETVQARQESIKPIDVTYTVLIEPEEDEDEMMIFKGVPRYAIRFFDSSYSSDMFLRTAFRHEIQLPDDMVPKSLRDLAR